MKKVLIFLADGFEEIEGLTPADLLRRGGLEVTTVSIMGRRTVTGRSRIPVEADCLFETCRIDEADALGLPGGMPGVTYLSEHQGLAEALKEAAKKGKLVCAICAGPTVLGGLGLLKGQKATCYPGCESGLTGADLSTDEVVESGSFITSRGAGTAIPFSLKIIERLTDRGNSARVAQSIVFCDRVDS